VRARGLRGPRIPRHHGSATVDAEADHVWDSSSRSLLHRWTHLCLSESISIRLIGEDVRCELEHLRVLGAAVGLEETVPTMSMAPGACFIIPRGTSRVPNSRGQRLFERGHIFIGGSMPGINMSCDMPFMTMLR